jgi:esterase/lipase superfamily enzyme
MHLLVFGHGGAKVLVFPTREGRFYDYENWGLTTALWEPVCNGHLQLFCVDSVDSESFYNRNCCPRIRIWRHKQYERYILDEVLPLMRADTADPFLVAHGCSIGAYHATTLALRHPGLFGKVVALSGRYDLTRPFGGFADLFDGYYDEDVYFYMPNHFLPQWTDGEALARMRRTQFVFAVGETDPFHDSTRQLSRQLWEKGVENTLAVWDGEAHRAKHWREMVRLYL